MLKKCVIHNVIIQLNIEAFTKGTSNQNLACFVRYLKITNTFWKILYMSILRWNERQHKVALFQIKIGPLQREK